MSTRKADRDPRISVVIPHKNQPEHLARCLASLAAQSFDMARAEIIVVDNGSKELPRAICAAADDVQLIEEPTPGPGPARNKGVSVARAPLLAFIDADCIADRDWLAAIAAAFEDASTQIIGGDVRIALATEGRMTMLEAYESVYAYRQKEYIEKQGFSGTGNLAMRRSVFDLVGPFADIGVAEDREWGRRATGMGLAIAYRPEMIVYHPARRSLSELYAKWDRHISHQYPEHTRRGLGKLRWVIKAVALSLSPLWEVAHIVRSNRVNTMRDRLLALQALVLVRCYRASRMLLLTNGRFIANGIAWNDDQ